MSNADTPTPDDRTLTQGMYLVRVGVPTPDGGYTEEVAIADVEVVVTLRDGVELTAIERSELTDTRREHGAPGMLDLVTGYAEERCYSDDALLSFRRFGRGEK